MNPPEHNRPAADITFEQWVTCIFDHPVRNPQWWWDDDLDEWDDSANPSRSLSLVTQLFENPEILIGRFTRAQIDQGLHYLINDCSSNYMWFLSDAGLPWAERRRCFDVMIPLYEKLMAPVYGNDLGHTQYGPGDPERPNHACYMWWDIIPLCGSMNTQDVDRINEAVLNVFEHVIHLKSEACLESVLHGLGHWHWDLPERTGAIVRRFLERTDISPELREYAEAAETGYIQ